RIMKLDRLRLRGLTGATDEFTLAATVQNHATHGQAFASRATDHGIGAPAESRNPQINPQT
ncbi:hypothetical protein, partial [Pseudomonas aeruginosa]|uniref:hypothetical protein n=1 Tax=Pseudomonas aeruginosa TaxID=287 RepID=UPI00196925C6